MDLSLLTEILSFLAPLKIWMSFSTDPRKISLTNPCAEGVDVCQGFGASWQDVGKCLENKILTSVPPFLSNPKTWTRAHQELKFLYVN